MMNRIHILIVAVALLASCNGNKDKADAYGNFEAVEYIISSEGNGKLLEFSAEEGSVLDSLQTVGLVDTLPLYLKKAQLIAQKRLSASKYINIQSQIDVQNEQKKNLERERNRLENLLKGGATPQKPLDEMNGNIDVLNSQIKSTETQRQMVADELRVYDRQIDQVNDQISKSFVINPVKGTVLEKYAEPHELVGTGKPLYKLADLRTLDLTAYISGAQLSSVKIGDTVKVYYDVDGKKMQSVPGVVYWVASKSEFTPKIIQTKDERVNLVYAIKVRTRNNGELKIGMPAEVRFK